MKNANYIIGLLFFITGCAHTASEKKESSATPLSNTIVLTEAQRRNAGIETGLPEHRKMTETIKLNGKIDVPPQNMVSVSVPLGGYLKSTKLLNGMPVAKGEVLAVVEGTQYIQLQQDYLSAKAQLLATELDFNRQKELNQSKATSDKVFEQTNAAYQTQQVVVRALEEKLKLIGLNPDKLTAANISNNINIYSPITGFVSAVNVNIGKYVNPSDVLFELVNPDDIHLALTVFENDISKLAVGQKLEAYTNTNPERKYPCTIILISKNLTAQSAAQAHCHFENYDHSLLPGMFMNANVHVISNDAATLPDEAVVLFDNKHYVFADKGANRFEMLEVHAGVSENGLTVVELPNGYANSDFVVKGAYPLLMALKNKE
ncbi:MAG: efflux RND transporter periplasmic adaptor subunit [Chitinophagales bacterium]